MPFLVLTAATAVALAAFLPWSQFRAWLGSWSSPALGPLSGLCVAAAAWAGPVLDSPARSVAGAGVGLAAAFGAAVCLRAVYEMVGAPPSLRYQASAAHAPSQWPSIVLSRGATAMVVAAASTSLLGLKWVALAVGAVAPAVVHALLRGPGVTVKPRLGT